MSKPLRVALTGLFCAFAAGSVVFLILPSAGPARPTGRD